MEIRVLRGLLLVFVLAWGSAAQRASGQDAPVVQTDTGTIAGVVLDKTSAQPIIEAGVEVVGTGKKTATDLDGKFTLKVPVGVHEIRIFAPAYQGTRLQKVAVKPNEVTKLDASLAPAGKAGVDVVEVVAQANRAAEATQLLQRKESAVVTDNISAETIRKTPGSAASDVVKRAPAVTVRNDRYVFVRGLGERYTSSNLNGSRLPSTDPQKRVIPLDLFPAEFLESLSVTKTYSPDLPGDFSGGLLDLRLREFPEQLAAGASVSAGYNTQSTGEDFQTYNGGKWDVLTYGDKARRLPRAIASRNLGDLPQSAAFRATRSFHNVWGGSHGPPDIDTAAPNTSGNVSVGDSFADGKFGLQLGAMWRNEYKQIADRQRQFTNAGTIDDPDIIERDDFLYNRSIFEARLGGLLTTAWKPSLNHKIGFRALLNRNGTDEVMDGSGRPFGFSPGENREQDITRIRWTEEELAWFQLAGEHRFPRLWIDWRSAAARTTQEEPDQRYLSYIGPPGEEAFVEDSLGGLRLYNSLKEYMSDSAVDFTVPFPTRLPFTDLWSGLPAKFKFGPAYSFRDRDFKMRQFQYEVPAGVVDSTLPAEELFDPMNIAPGEIEQDETTLLRDQFSATQEIIAGYGMFDLPIVRSRLRLVGGVRMEYSYIELTTFDQLEDKQLVRKNTLDPLPGVNLIYSPRNDMNVRGSWSRTVSRPEFRELSPTVFPAPRGLRPLFGNPSLVQSEIESWDLRWEWFFSPLELVSLSFFHKEIKQPIEQVVIAVGSSSADSFANADTATLLGFEFEGRKDFGFLGHRLRDLSILTNVTYAESEVTAPVSGVAQVQTNTERQLQGQPLYVVNASLDYTKPDVVSARLLYSTADRVITNAGSFGLPDIFDERRNSLDAVVSVPLKRWLGYNMATRLSVENILNDPQESTQGGLLQRNYSTGVKFTLGLGYTF